MYVFVNIFVVFYEFPSSLVSPVCLLKQGFRF